MPDGADRVASENPRGKASGTDRFPSFPEGKPRQLFLQKQATVSTSPVQQNMSTQMTFVSS